MCVSALSFAKRFALCKRYQLLLFYSDDKLNKRRQKKARKDIKLMECVSLICRLISCRFNGKYDSSLLPGS